MKEDLMFKKKTEEVKKSTLEVLQERSGNAVKVITDTIDDLKSTNEAIKTQKQVIAEKIEALNMEDNTLTDLNMKNNRIVANFEALLN